MPLWPELSGLESSEKRNRPRSEHAHTTTFDHIPASSRPLCQLLFCSQLNEERCPLVEHKHENSVQMTAEHLQPEVDEVLQNVPQVENPGPVVEQGHHVRAEACL